MKKFNFLWIGLAAIALVVTGCAKDQGPDTPPAGKNGQLTIKIKASNPGNPNTRSLFDLGGAVGTALTGFESTINNFSVYVFNANNNMFEQSVLNQTGNTATISGLDMNSPKRVVVIANHQGLPNSTIPTYTVGNTYDELASGALSIQDQTYQWGLILSVLEEITGNTTGLLMTGEYDSDIVTAGTQPYTIIAGDDNEIEVLVERVVAKVELGQISFGAGVTIADILKFRISGAGVQRVAATSPITPYPSRIANTPTAWYGGWGENTTGGPALRSTALDGLKDDSGLLNDLIPAVINGVAGLPIVSTLMSAISPILSALEAGVTPIDELIGMLLAVPAPFLNGGDALQTLGDLLAGISVSDLSGTVATLLTGIDVGGFWYVLPNNPGATVPAPDPFAGTRLSTLLTLKGTFDGEDYYYPLRINDPKAVITGTGSGGVANNYVQRNTIYHLNVEFTGSLIGSTDPDTPETFENINVTVRPVDWLGPVEQDATW